jgi:pimeloyl-ACP methyl ester carboxylesterase
MPAWSRPDCSRLSSLGSGAGGRPCQAATCVALDYRGHGQSEYDRNPDNYTFPVLLADLSAVLIALEIAPAIFVGTSYGGLLAMMLAVWRPTAIAGVILNDIGPVMEPQGLVRIKGYVGKLPVPRSFEEGAEILRWWFDAQFPRLQNLNQLGSGLNFLIRRSQLQILFLHERHELVEVL